MTKRKIQLDDLQVGGMLGVLQTLGLGAEKRLMCRKLYLLIISLLASCHIDNYTYNIHVHCLSAMIILQRTNEQYKTIQNPNMKLKQNAYQNARYALYCISGVILCNFFLWLSTLLLLSGDSHPNLSPDSVGTDTSISSSLSSFHMLSSYLSVMHLNIQSLLQKG